MHQADTVGKFYDTVGNRVEEIAVVCDKQTSPGIIRQKFFHPLNRLRVEMIGGLIQNQKIGPGDDRTTQGNAALLSAGQCVNGAIFRRGIQRMHNCFNPVLEIPTVQLMQMLFENVPPFRRVRKRFILFENADYVMRAFPNILIDSSCRIKLKILREKPDHQITAARDSTCIRLHQSGNDSQQCRFSGTIPADEADSVILPDVECCGTEYVLIAKMDGDLLCCNNNRTG